MFLILVTKTVSLAVNLLLNFQFFQRMCILMRCIVQDVFFSALLAHADAMSDGLQSSLFANGTTVVKFTSIKSRKSMYLNINSQ